MRLVKGKTTTAVKKNTKTPPSLPGAQKQLEAGLVECRKLGVV